MTHQPPIPKEATSPYPIQPPPIPEAVKQRAAEAEAARAEEGARPSRNAVIGVGAAMALGTAAAVGGLFYAKRRSASTAPAAKRGKGKRGKARKTSETRH